MNIARRPYQPGDQKHVDEKLNARLRQKVLPEQARATANQSERGHRQNNRRDDAD